MAGRKNGKKMPAVHAPVVDFMGFLHSVEDNSVTTEIYDHSKVLKTWRVGFLLFPSPIPFKF
jgi:hypothetical protein